ncbi:hypothetical protein PYCCODRAFT_1437948 [Trametes coccinea BRFM310]|uniref:Uncharacterized protein n=1 Tax=Trametes coccinea (strain BRFM310) TaxID=1353009 RepID=A0A1Y2IHM5_TRAC3|nr:hypothetical protein PYCCODRAFT_1437948 [Trametes coccinea BRFM310]
MLHRDLPTLRSAALVSRSLLPAAREELFRIVDADILKYSSMRPFLVHVEELCFIARHRPLHVDLDQLFLSGACPHPQSMPKFRAIHFMGSITVLYVYDFQRLGALQLFRSVRELTLHYVVLTVMRELQAVLCLFPNLERLSMAMVGFSGEEAPGRPRPAPGVAPRPPVYPIDRERQPRLVQLRMGEQIRTRNPVPELAEWLLRGPSRDTLKTLIASFRSRSPQDVLSHFGPTIEHIALPLQELHSTVYDGYLKRYTNLRTLSVLLQSYNTTPGAWFILPSFLTHMPTARLHTLTIDVRLDYPLQQLGSAIYWTALDRVNEALDEDKFEALRKVEVIVRWKERLGWKPEKAQADVFVRNVSERLYHVEEAGKLAVTLEMVKEFWDTVPGRREASNGETHGM